MPGVDDTNYKTKASFHPSLRLLWPRPANTSHSANTRWNFTRFYICADTEWWWDIQILFVTRCDGRVCQDCDRSLITGDKLCLHLHWGVITRRYYANQWLSFKKLSSSADIHECWHLRTDDEAVIIRERTLQPDQTLSWVSSSYYASPHQFYISDWSRCWEKTRHEESWEEERADGTTSERCRV